MPEPIVHAAAMVVLTATVGAVLTLACWLAATQTEAGTGEYRAVADALASVDAAVPDPDPEPDPDSDDATGGDD